MARTKEQVARMVRQRSSKLRKAARPIVRQRLARKINTRFAKLG